jgi:hypothetical protein
MGKDINDLDLKSWLWVLLWIMVIFASVPVARGFQRFIYKTVGREFFTYFVFFVIACGLITILYFLIFRLKTKRASQYIWLLACFGFYAYLIIKLRTYPEEAIHLLEYGLLSYFYFRALSHSIQDWTVYFTAGFFVMFTGTFDELLQWTMPNRYWGIKDIGLNTVAGGVFLLAINRGICPRTTQNKVKGISIKTLAGIIAVNLLFLGVCFSNTPDSVRVYTSRFQSLSWLRGEEPMIEYGHKHRDPEIGTFFSRFSIKELRRIDRISGESYGKMLAGDINKGKNGYKHLMNIYTPLTNPFLHEFLLHLSRRDENLIEFEGKTDMNEDAEKNAVAVRQNIIIEKYFGSTLEHSGLRWPGEKAENLKRKAVALKKDYESDSGNIITSFTPGEFRMAILVMLVLVWFTSRSWLRRIEK